MHKRAAFYFLFFISLSLTLTSCLVKSTITSGTIQDAARLGDTRSVKKRLTKDVDINAKDKHGITLLMYASINGRTDTVKLLLKKGADINIKNNDGISAMDCAEKKGNSELIAMLKAAGGGTLNYESA